IHEACGAAGAGVEEDNLTAVVDDGVAGCAILLKSKRIVVEDGGVASCGVADELHRELRSGGKKNIYDSGAAGRAGAVENHKTSIVDDGSAAGRAGAEAKRTAVYEVGGSAIQDDAGAKKVDTPGEEGGINDKIVVRRPRIKCPAVDVGGGGG